jgi:hypothetical protein
VSTDGRNELYPKPTESSATALHDAVSSPRRVEMDAPSPEQIEILRRMTPGQRWQAAHRLYWTCRRHKAAFLRSQHPDWPEERVENEVRDIFAHART